MKKRSPAQRRTQFSRVDDAIQNIAGSYYSPKYKARRSRIRAWYDIFQRFGVGAKR